MTQKNMPSTALTEDLPDSNTGLFIEREGDKAPIFQLQDLLDEPNSRHENDTCISERNGNSYPLVPRPESRRPTRMNPPAARSTEHFRAIAKWEGQVVEVHEDDDSFLAKLSPLLVGPNEIDEEVEAEILLDEVTEDDLGLVQTGAGFYWTIGYLHRPTGHISASVLRFKRLPGWSGEELNEAKEKARSLRSFLDAE